MEGSPYSPEINLDDPELERKVKPRAENIGSFALESKPEKNPNHSPELIGHVLVDSESKQSVDKINSPASMSRGDLLKLSESIIIDGSSLRSIFESHLIGERGLRKLVAENMKGGDLKRALNVEILDRELDFERDPAMRDHYNYSGEASDSPATITELLDKAQTEIKADTEEVTFLKAQARYKKKQVKSDKNSRRIIDVAMVSTILVLATLVAVLLLANR